MITVGGVAILLRVVACATPLPVASPDPVRSLTAGSLNTINGAVTLDEAGLGVACPAFDLVFGRSYNRNLQGQANSKLLIYN